ncbi:hypothetical protein I3W98_40985, partial [Streptomyces cavourensis]|nr:hypothetical protein [Streptomyces cavourensis]
TPPPTARPKVRSLFSTASLGPDEARAAVAAVTGGAAFAALDDFTLATPSLEDVYLALGGDAANATKGLVKA